MMGSGGFIVLDEDQCVVKHTYTLARFYHHESCGQCSPCREGTGWMEKILLNIENGKGKMSDIDLLWDIQRKIEGNTICPLGDAAAWPVAAAIRHFRDEFEWHVLNPDECLKRNYGLAHYADPIHVPVYSIKQRLISKDNFYVRRNIKWKKTPATFKVTIDNITIDVAPGTTILNAARQIGGDVTPPAMCYYSKLEGSGGKCRTCLVEVAAGSTADPRPMPKLVASCRTTVMDGMIVKNITSEKVIDARNGVVEFLLINHPLDCPICDQAGECHLQDLGYDHGKEGTRYEFKRRTFEKEDIGPYIQLHMTRCILCYRCTYIADQITDKRVHGILDRGDHAEISTYISKAIDNDFSGNMIDVCPVGALTDRTFRFKNRVWFTKASRCTSKLRKSKMLW